MALRAAKASKWIKKATKANPRVRSLPYFLAHVRSKFSEPSLPHLNKVTEDGGGEFFPSTNSVTGS